MDAKKNDLMCWELGDSKLSTTLGTFWSRLGNMRLHNAYIGNALRQDNGPSWCFELRSDC